MHLTQTLLTIQLVVGTTFGKQLCMVAGLHDSAPLDHQNAARSAYGTESVGNDETDATGKEVFQPSLNSLLGHGVYRRRGLVHHQNLGVCQYRAGE